jgi:hypothetical protein
MIRGGYRGYLRSPCGTNAGVECRRRLTMGDKLKRYEKVEYLGEGQVIKKPIYAVFTETGYVMQF